MCLSVCAATPCTATKVSCLDGRTGEIIWHRTNGPDEWGCGGGWVAIYDFDHDGLDDIVTFYPHVCYGMDGASGELFLGANVQQSLWLPGLLRRSGGS